MTVTYSNGFVSGDFDVLSIPGQRLPLTQLLGKANPAQAIANFQTPNDGVFHQYLFSGGAVISAFTSGTLNVNLIFTDESGAVRTQANVVGGAAGFFSIAPITFLAKPNTTITFNTTGSLVGTFDVFGSILLVA